MQAESAAAIFPNGAAEKFGESPVPVIAPTGMSEEQRAGFAESFRALQDGFLATLPGESYDVVVNGTRRYVEAPEEAEPIDRPEDVTDYAFSETDEGASLSFSRFNTDYALDFMCHEAMGGEASCVEADAAEALADGMVLVGGGEQ